MFEDVLSPSTYVTLTPHPYIVATLLDLVVKRADGMRRCVVNGRESRGAISCRCDIRCQSDAPCAMCLLAEPLRGGLR
jgi:hypothetical protein